MKERLLHGVKMMHSITCSLPERKDESTLEIHQIGHNVTRFDECLALIIKTILMPASSFPRLSANPTYQQFE